MTSSLFLEWLQDLDREMQLQQRKILLFLDNAPSHPKDVSLTNVKLQFFPANTTSKLQPLDQGIILNMKVHVHYHKCLLCKVLAILNADNPPLASTIASSINVLDCSLWVAAAVKEISAATVIHCFAHAGFSFQSTTEAVSEPENNSTDELESLISFLSSSLSLEQPLCAEQFVSFDNDVPASEVLTQGWEQELLQDFLCDREEPVTEEDSTTGEATTDEEIPDFRTSLRWMQQIKLLASEKKHGYFSECLCSR